MKTLSIKQIKQVLLSDDKYLAIDAFEPDVLFIRTNNQGLKKKELLADYQNWNQIELINVDKDVNDIINRLVKIKALNRFVDNDLVQYFIIPWAKDYYLEQPTEGASEAMLFFTDIIYS